MKYYVSICLEISTLIIGCFLFGITNLRVLLNFKVHLNGFKRWVLFKNEFKLFEKLNL